MKNVLVLLHDDDGQESRLQVALDLTRAFSGHLTALDVVVPPAVVTDYTGVADAMVLQYAVEHETANRARLAERLAKEDVAWSIIDRTGSPADELQAAADLADVIVVSSRPGEHTPLDATHTASQLATNTHRPVLAVPPGCNGLNVEGKAVVAWDGSHEANEALRAATPMLARAKSVTLLEVNRSYEDYPVDEAASYLSRHGIHAKVTAVETPTSSSSAILEKAGHIGAAYIVMGAYGPGRMLEALFGGVTANMLHESEVPLLLAH